MWCLSAPPFGDLLKTTIINRIKTINKKPYKMIDLFNNPISKTKVRNGIFAYKYANGCININGQKFFDYSIKEAIKIWKSKQKK